MSTEQRIRAILFYLSVFSFLIGLPFILSFALGYKFNINTFKFTKTGLISIKTQPQGAIVYFNNKLLNDKTPLTINELLPGKYSIRLEIEGHYPYFREIEVDEGKVTRLEKVILFPLRTDIKQLNKEKFTLAFPDEPRNLIYYINQDECVIYRSDTQGEHFEKISDFLPLAPAPKGWVQSWDKDKILCFNSRQIEIIYLQKDKELFFKESFFVINYPSGPINQVFWYSDNYHIVVVSDSRIDILEANPQSSAVTAVRLNKKNALSFYDERTDSIYFTDSQKAADGKVYDNLYKMELSARSFPLQELIKTKTDEY